MRKSIAVFLLAALAAFAPLAKAAQVVINATNSGWYKSTGENPGGGMNYIVGQLSSPSAQYHDFFVFDLSGLGIVTSAQLALGNPSNGYFSPKPAESLTYYDVTTPISHLGDSSVPSVAIYTDLGSGIAYGTQQVSAADNGNVVDITLNSDAISALNASRGMPWAIGGAMTSQDQPPGVDEYMFGSSDFTYTRQLILQVTPTPEPSTLALASLGFAALVAWRWRRR